MTENMKKIGLGDLCEAIMTLASADECAAFFEDLCTMNELRAMVQRLQVAKKLAENESYAKIADETGVSSATISRVNRCLQYGDGGYRTVLDRLGK